MFRFVAFFSIMILSRAFVKSPTRFGTRLMATVGGSVPSGVMVDLITGEDSKEVDIGAVLAKSDKAVIFAVPGAFTPTCSAKHLPGFVENAAAFKAKGVSDIFCMSVNDKFVMKSWGAATPGANDAGIKFVADGNGEYANALDLVADKTGGRMGNPKTLNSLFLSHYIPPPPIFLNAHLLHLYRVIYIFYDVGMRCTRFAAVVEGGKFTLLNVDESGFDKSAAEVVLAAL